MSKQDTKAAKADEISEKEISDSSNEEEEQEETLTSEDEDTKDDIEKSSDDSEENEEDSQEEIPKRSFSDTKKESQSDDSNSAREQYESTRKSIAEKVETEGAEYLLSLKPNNLPYIDPDDKSKGRWKKSDVDATIKSIWGKEAKTLEDAQKVIISASTQKSLADKGIKDKKVIEEIVNSKLENQELRNEFKDFKDNYLSKENEKLTAKQLEQEQLDQGKLDKFLEKHPSLQKENDPNDENWNKFILEYDTYQLDDIDKRMEKSFLLAFEDEDPDAAYEYESKEGSIANDGIAMQGTNKVKKSDDKERDTYYVDTLPDRFKPKK